MYGRLLQQSTCRGFIAVRSGSLQARQPFVEPAPGFSATRPWFTIFSPGLFSGRAGRVTGLLPLSQKYLLKCLPDCHESARRTCETGTGIEMANCSGEGAIVRDWSEFRTAAGSLERTQSGNRQAFSTGVRAGVFEAVAPPLEFP